MLLGLTLAAPTLTVGPAALSYPDLAAALTKAGMPCVASASLGERGAYVRLKGRSPESVRRVLKEALGVAFVPVERGWRMVVDPETKERDRLLLIAYRRQMADAAQAWAREEEGFRRGKTYTNLRIWMEERTPGVEKLGKDDPDAVRQVADVAGAFGAARLASWFGVRSLRDAALVGRTLDGPQSRFVGGDEAARILGFPLARLSRKDSKAAVALKLGVDYSFQRGTLHVESRCVDATGEPTEPSWPWKMTVPGWSLSGEIGGGLDLSVEGKTLRETFDRMGSHAQRYLAGFAALDDLPEKPVGRSPVSRSLSSHLERLDLESAMELSPNFEEVETGVSPESLSLRSILEVKELTDSVMPVQPPWLDRLTSTGRWSRAARARKYPWRALRRDGVWIVANPLAFLDRLHPDSPVPYLRIENLLRDLPEDAAIATFASGDRLPDWRLLTKIARAVPPGTIKNLGYRGTASGIYVDLLSTARLIADVIPPTQHAELWQAASKPGGVRWATPKGTLILTKTSVRTETDKSPIALVEARWEDQNGPRGLGQGYVDARGLG